MKKESKTKKINPKFGGRYCRVIRIMKSDGATFLIKGILNITPVMYEIDFNDVCFIHFNDDDISIVDYDEGTDEDSPFTISLK